MSGRGRFCRRWRRCRRRSSRARPSAGRGSVATVSGGRPSPGRCRSLDLVPACCIDARLVLDRGDEFALAHLCHLAEDEPVLFDRDELPVKEFFARIDRVRKLDRRRLDHRGVTARRSEDTGHRHFVERQDARDLWQRLAVGGGRLHADVCSTRCVLRSPAGRNERRLGGAGARLPCRQPAFDVTLRAQPGFANGSRWAWPSVRQSAPLIRTIAAGRDAQTQESERFSIC